MRPLARHALAVAGLALAACSASLQVSGRHDAARDESAIRAALDTTAAGWNRGDLATYMAMYTDSVMSNGAEGFLVGKAGVEQVMRRGFWRTGRPLQQLRYEQIHVRAIGPDHALVTGKFVLTGADRPDRTGLFTTMWVRTRDGWRMEHDHSG